MAKVIKNLILISFITVLTSIFVWLPFTFGFGGGLNTIFANYDGPNYIIIAKSLYDRQFISSNFSIPLPLEYYPAHLPGYPLIIKFFDLFLAGTWAMLLTTLITTVLAVIAFYFLLLKFKLSSSPIMLSLIFLFFPARWFVVRNVGSVEPLFIFAIITSFYFFKSAFDEKSNNLFPPVKSVTFDFFLAGLFGALAVTTKTPGILLFISYLIYLIFACIKSKKIYWQAWPLFMIPISLLSVFLFYQFKIGDFFAYFHSGDNIHLVFPPFQSLISQGAWLGDFWLEDMIYVYLFGILSFLILIKKKLYDLAIFAGVFFLALIFVAHRDLSRYSLPLAPFALIAFSDFLEKKEFKIAFLFVLLPIYLYAINFILHNTSPIADWTPYL